MHYLTLLLALLAIGIVLCLAVSKYPVNICWMLEGMNLPATTTDIMILFLSFHIKKNLTSLDCYPFLPAFLPASEEDGPKVNPLTWFSIQTCPHLSYLQIQQN